MLWTKAGVCLVSAAAAVGMLGIPGECLPQPGFLRSRQRGDRSGEAEGGIGKYLSKAEGFFSNLIGKRSAKEGGNWVKALLDCKAPETRG